MPGEDLLTSGISQMAGNVGAGLSGIISGVSGFFQKKKGNKILSENPRPTENIPPEVLANQEMAKQMALEGMPSQQYQAAQKNIQRQQATALASAQDKRLGGALIPAIQEGTNTATGNLDAESAGIRRQNQLNLQNVNNTVAGWKDRVWQWNQRDKYIQNYNYGMSLVGMGNQNMLAGADKILGAAVNTGAQGGFFGGGGGNNSAGSSSYVQQPNPYGTGGPQIL